MFCLSKQLFSHFTISIFYQILCVAMMEQPDFFLCYFNIRLNCKVVLGLSFLHSQLSIVFPTETVEIHSI